MAVPTALEVVASDGNATTKQIRYNYPEGLTAAELQNIVDSGFALDWDGASTLFVEGINIISAATLPAGMKVGAEAGSTWGDVGVNIIGRDAVGNPGQQFIPAVDNAYIAPGNVPLLIGSMQDIANGLVGGGYNDGTLTQVSARPNGAGLTVFLKIDLPRKYKRR